MSSSMKSGRAAREVLYDLPSRSQSVVLEWVALGHPLYDALLESNVLGKGEPVTPRDARREQLRKNDRRESAEHESAHAVAASALGLKVKSAEIADDDSGSCVYVAGTKLESAIVLMAPEIWLDRFRRDQFPYGPKGLKADHRALTEIGDALILRTAMKHCVEILRQNSALVLALSDRIEKNGRVVAPWS
jgi:hypothetical protein